MRSLLYRKVSFILIDNASLCKGVVVVRCDLFSHCTKRITGLYYAPNLAEAGQMVPEL